MANTLWCLGVGREEGGAQVIPTNVTFKKAGFVCHIEMLGLKIQVCDTCGFRVGMRGKDSGTKHQGKIISLKLQKFTRKYALCLHVTHVEQEIQYYIKELMGFTLSVSTMKVLHLEITESWIVKKIKSRTNH